MVNSQAIGITSVLVACLISVVVFLNDSGGGEKVISSQSKWSVTTNDGADQTWYLDTNAGVMKVETDIGFGKIETVEWSGAGVSSFESTSMGGWDADDFCEKTDMGSSDVECADFAAALKQDVDAMVAESKTACTPVAPEEFIVSQDKDSLSVGPFTVALGSDGLPSSISSGEWSATINSIENDVSFDIEGCDARRHTEEGVKEMDFFDVIGESRRRMEVSEGVSKARDMLTNLYVEMFFPERKEEAQRKLGYLTDVTQWASGTFWCGPGTPMQGIAVGAEFPVGGNERLSDVACYRHDHGTCFQDGARFGLPRIACSVDNDLNRNTYEEHRSGWPYVIQAIYGEVSISAVIGCHDRTKGYSHHAWRAPYACGWRGCNGGWWEWHAHAPGWVVKYGRNRYKTTDNNNNPAHNIDQFRFPYQNFVDGSTNQWQDQTIEWGDEDVIVRPGEWCVGSLDGNGSGQCAEPWPEIGDGSSCPAGSFHKESHILDSVVGTAARNAVNVRGCCCPGDGNTC